MNENTWDEELLESIWQQRMSLSYKMLLIREMANDADREGRMELSAMASRFSAFFRQRRVAGKAEDNPNRFKSEPLLSDRSIEEWEKIILDEPIAHFKSIPIRCDGKALFWELPKWSRWSPGFKKAIASTADVRLIEYFERNVPGGY